MVCKVTLYKAGKVWDEEVIAIDYQDAKQVALARNPGASVMSVTAVMGQLRKCPLNWHTPQ